MFIISISFWFLFSFYEIHFFTIIAKNKEETIMIIIFCCCTGQQIMPGIAWSKNERGFLLFFPQEQQLSIKVGKLL